MKKFISCVMLLLACVLLVACNNNNQSETATPSGSSTEVVPADMATLAELKEATDVKVVFRVSFGGDIRNAIQTVIDEFQREWPNVTVEMEVVTGNYDTLKTKNGYSIDAGTLPTISVGYPDHFSEYLIRGSLQSLDIFTNSTDVGITDTGKEVKVGYTEEELNDFVSGYIKENKQYDTNGTLYGLPLNKSTEAFFYNKSFFEYFELEVPKTWDDVKTVSQKIMTEILPSLTEEEAKEEGAWLEEIYTQYKANKFMPMMYDSTGNFFTTICHQWGGKYTTAIYRQGAEGKFYTDLQKGNLNFKDDEKVLEAMTYMQNLAKDGYVNFPNYWESNYGSNFFVTGNIVMNIGSSAGSSYYNSAKCEVGITTVPYYNEANKCVIQQGTNICMFTTATKLEKLAGWLFIKELLKPENTVNFAIATGYLPVRVSSYSLETYTDFLKSTLITAAVHKAIAEYTTDTTWSFFVDPAWNGSSKVRDECGNAALAIMTLFNNPEGQVAKAIADAVGRIG